MVKGKIHKYITLILLLLAAGALYGQNKKMIKAGAKIAEPFVIKDSSGYSGIAVALWEEVSRDLGLYYNLKEYSLEGILEAASKKQIDIAIAPITLTARRESEMDFTHPWFSTGLSIAARGDEKKGLWAVTEKLFSTEFWEILMALSLLLFIAGFVTWLFERNKNDEFRDGKTRGLGSSFWWAAVTMTTVGYGDKAPKTVGGRIIGLIWMFTGIIVISSFTAAIASALTVTQLETKVRGLNDLYDVTVGTVSNSSSAAFLDEKRIGFREYAAPSDLIEALNGGEVEAVIYDAPILRYLIRTKDLSQKIRVLDMNLKPQYYGFALPENSFLLEDVNRSLLKILNSPAWEDIKYKYLGE